jgi:hypothetical protein
MVDTEKVEDVGDDFKRFLELRRGSYHKLDSRPRQTKPPKDKATLIRRQKNKLARKARRVNRK